MNSLKDLQEKIGYIFKDEGLLRQALTHQSFANDNNAKGYDRLEFLGDAVIELVVSDYIYKNCSFDSGLSSKLRAALVSTENLYKIAIMLGLDGLVLKSKSLQTLSKKNTADLFESVIGAVYIDGGLNQAKVLIDRYVIVDDKNINYILKNSIDYKTNLQELMQKEGKVFEYKLISSTGLDHEKVFEVGLVVEGKMVAVSKGNSIRHAEESAAENYIKTL